MTTETQTGKKQFCTFAVAGHLFGIDVMNVQEILRRQELTRVPKAPPEVAGLLNLRGSILTAIDLRKRLGFPASEHPAGIHVIVAGSDGSVDLLADEVRDVLEVDISAFEDAPEYLEGGLKGVVSGVYKLEEGLLLVLDPDAVAEWNG